MPTGAKVFENFRGHTRKRNNERKKHKEPPLNVVRFRLSGFPLDALDQKRMRRLRRMSDRTGVPIPDLISEIVGRVIEIWLAEAELTNKIVKFPADGR